MAAQGAGGSGQYVLGILCSIISGSRKQQDEPHAALYTCIRNWFNSIKSSTKLFSLRRKVPAAPGKWARWVGCGEGRVGGSVNTRAVRSQRSCLSYAKGHFAVCYSQD